MTWLVVWSSLLFALGLCLGLYIGVGWGERRGYRNAELDRANVDEFVAEVDANTEAFAPAETMARRTYPAWRGTRGGTVMPYRPELPEVIRSLEARGYAFEAAAKDQAHETWMSHAEQAMNLANDEPPPYAFPAWSLLNADPPTLGEEIQAMIANANAVPSVRWLDRLGDQ